MIGVYDYTVILTYLSMISGVTGIILAMTGIGHPYLGALFLMFSGLFDAFDGKIARTKKGRSDFEKKFGVQIDSLSDLICFGVLPAAIGIALLRKTERFMELRRAESTWQTVLAIAMIAIADIYVLMALIRLAYFNSTEEERAEEKRRTGVEHFTGMPVTSAALVFPTALIIQWFIAHFITPLDLTIVYFCIMLVLAMLFVGSFKIPKFGKKGLSILVVIGVIELAAMIYIFIMGAP